MKLNTINALVLGAGMSLFALSASAQSMDHAKMGHGHMDHAGMDHSKMGHGMGHHGGHHHMSTPIGVMGAHVMPQGKFMLSYRYMHMDMNGMRQGTTDLSDDYVATNVPNRFFGMPGQPPTTRIVPDRMTMDMHMFGAMYGLSERVTVMGMLPYIKKEMRTTTYQGPAGTNVLGSNKMKSEGIGDLRFSAIMDLAKSEKSSLTGMLGVSLPTGSITETGQMLSPMGMRPTMRMAYPMQLGSGTVDLHPAITWQTNSGPINWGAQVRGSIRLGSNDEGYSLGDAYALSAWASTKVAPWLSLSGRIEAQTIGSVDGIDRNIMGPMPGTNPAFIGGDYVTIFAGADITPKQGALKGHKIGLEVGVPVYQDLNGPMLKRDWSAAIAWRKSF
jgi:hypothetical protein